MLCNVANYVIFNTRPAMTLGYFNTRTILNLTQTKYVLPKLQFVTYLKQDNTNTAVYNNVGILCRAYVLCVSQCADMPFFILLTIPPLSQSNT